MIPGSPADRAGLRAGDLAERLQLSLLSPPVQPDHLELAVRYRPATQGVSIGGDWYDAFLQPDGATVLVIGDVMGHDIEAAAAMGQVKTLVRGIAYDRLEEPAEVLRRVDHALVGLAVPAMATALVCRVEQDDAERAAGAAPAALVVGRSSGADAAAGRRHRHRPDGPGRAAAGYRLAGPPVDGAPIPPDSTLLLFTDGLFERRACAWTRAASSSATSSSRSAHLPLALLCDAAHRGAAG